MPTARTPFPPVFWIANVVEVLERFSYYGIYFGFGIYMAQLGYTRAQLGVVQSLFLMLSYVVPVISGTFADRYGFKPVFIVSCLAYLPSILLLILTKSFAGIVMTMLSIGLAAGIFKPLVSGTVRVTSDTTNKTLGFGIFYAMVNVGGSFGPLIAGRLRAVSWDYAFYAAAASIVVMLAIIVLFYQEPPRQLEGTSLGQKFADIGVALSDLRFATFLLLLALFFWLPFWAFFNMCALYVDSAVDTARLYQDLRGVFGASFADFLSTEKDGVRRVLGESISHTGYVIMVLQIFISGFLERFRAIPSLIGGLAITGVGFVFLGMAAVVAPSFVFLGIFLFAIGEMVASPRIQEYITWIAPKEKAGLYMGSNFLATGIGGALSGVTYTALYGHFADGGHPEHVWYTLSAHMAIAVVVFLVYTRVAGEFVEREA